MILQFKTHLKLYFKKQNWLLVQGIKYMNRIKYNSEE